MKRVLLTVAALLIAQAAFAQTVVVITSTSTGQFTASPDQTTVGIDGNPLLTSYQATACTTAATPVCLAPANLGKPTPNAGNIITFPVASLGALVPNIVYVVTIEAIGPGGASTPDGPSNPFGAEGAPRPVASATVIIR